ncbi:hypothetical protein ABAC460_14470 [Asticcacaulis sp. AC460]|uniref:LacI family DNA-binding transcriptional regulator n=1 Tax=Asticcacaulis sp. AC460 TaxID=1282360 RepID=UPI0003C3BEF0|nr:LacI family DNA-binding transcriptional regulator [Asticcacaulis sp. AC460]ESQ88982.1 hypothetical protein ABAC460_14470 [Asticcacaulis sp. AC460]
MSFDRVSHPVNGTPVAKMRLADLARLAGVSVATVSRSLQDSPLINRTTKSRVRQLAADNGFFLPQAGPAAVKRVTVAVMMPVREEALHAALLPGLVTAMRELRCNLLFVPLGQGAFDDLPRVLDATGADAFLFFDEREARSALAALKTHRFVVWGGGEGPYRRVAPDNFAAGQAAVRHLAEAGCRRIAYLGETEGADTTQRFMGYLTGLNEAGLAVDPSLILSSLDDAPQGFDGLFIASESLARTVPDMQTVTVGEGAERAARLSLDVHAAGRRVLSALLNRKDAVQAGFEKIAYQLTPY